MNFSDSEIVASILSGEGFLSTENITEADIILVNTCSIRDHAEQRVKKRLQQFRSYKKKNPRLVIGLLGCMADRIKTVLKEEEYLLDVVAGPDVYRDLPKLLEQVEAGQRGVNTLLSMEETYADITPVRLGSNGVSAFISIMRGCENYCSYCVVPAARGHERSREPASIIQETAVLLSQGYREVTLLGQNVNSYLWKENGREILFSDLLARVALVSPLMRIRFATSHPKDLSDELLETIARYSNICRAIHLPVQSGSTRILDRMNRKYNREDYLKRIDAIRRIIPGCAISTDIITGFCDETEEDHRMTLTLMEAAAFDYAFQFKYSERPQTLAAETLKDNVPEVIKDRRLKEVIALQQKLSLHSNKRDLGKIFEVLVEGESRRSTDHFMGRTSHNKVVVFPKTASKPGTYVRVKVLRCTSATLIGEVQEG
ncbi:MAG: tRNA (N6-isopentenyl adenosine(37)-C2)-methylthiotransferase MiaB [bacterium]